MLFHKYSHLKKNYSWLIALAGHTDAQAPQSTQVPASITRLPSPSEIAVTGHSPSHIAQFTQESEITCAIISSKISEIK